MPTIWPGNPYPLGATYDGRGTNFSLFSEVADRVDLCLFDADGRETTVTLPEADAYRWHGYLPDIKPGQHYGFRVHGPWAPDDGHRCNPAKLLLDPYATSVCGTITWNEALFAHRFADPEHTRNDDDSAAYMPKCVVMDPAFDWQGDARPGTPLHQSIIYEVHVKGFTARHPDIPPELRGTYAGLAHPAAIKYLTDLGVTAVELLPVHQFVDDWPLQQRGLRNYWGYNSIGYFAPHNAYASKGQCGQQVREFKELVRTMHRAGIEVILDVVYNHTAEGNHRGPTLSFKGVDNAAYYRLVPDQRRYYMDYTGTGNTMNMRQPYVLQLILDSLRYWVTEMHVDGFRFDLAATLARELHEVDRLSSFFDLIQQDPVVSQVKLIAEPWDVGEGGYQVGNFPPLWSEWNGRYRDTVRDYWRGVDQTLDDFAYRFTGSSDLYESSARRPSASINFVTAHDGFTLRDLVSFNDKHNEANGEENRDGESHNRSWNMGVEGETTDPVVLAARGQQQRNFLTTLLLSQGIPMLLAGDEIGRTQRGNNNAYCQDSELSWHDWTHVDQPLLAFVKQLIQIRQDHPVFSRRRWFQGQSLHGTTVSDIGWFTPDGHLMTDEEWAVGYAKSIGIFLNGNAIPYLGPHGERITDDSFYIVFNAHYELIEFTLPSAEWGKRVELVFDTAAAEDAGDRGEQFVAGQKVPVQERSVCLLRYLE
jgi:glycogen operon protein